MQKEISILQNLKIKLNIIDNKYNIPIDKLFNVLAYKDEEKDYFLASKVTGQYNFSDPKTIFFIAALLSNELVENKYLEETKKRIVNTIINPDDKKSYSFFKYLQSKKMRCNKDTLIIGLGENGVSLAHCIFNYMRSNCYYSFMNNNKIKNIKESIRISNDKETLYLYLKDKNIFLKTKRVVIVEEVIQDNSLISQLIDQLKNKGIDEIICMSILDIRSDIEINKNNYKDIKNISLYRGYIESNSKKIQNPIRQIKNDLVQTKLKTLNININNLYLYNVDSLCNKPKHFVEALGLFGLDIESNQICLSEIYKYIKNLKFEINTKTMFMGFGEMNFISLMIAANFNHKIQMNSPSIEPLYVSDKKGYPLYSVDKIRCPYGTNKYYYIYNLSGEFTDKVILFLERKPIDQFVEDIELIMNRRGIKNLTLIYF